MQNHILGFGNNIRLKDTKTVYYLLTFLFEFAAGLIFATYVLLFAYTTLHTSKKTRKGLLVIF